MVRREEEGEERRGGKAEGGLGGEKMRVGRRRMVRREEEGRNVITSL
jgi:hypothetical protein